MAARKSLTDYEVAKIVSQALEDVKLSPEAVSLRKKIVTLDHDRVAMLNRILDSLAARKEVFVKIDGALVFHLNAEDPDVTDEDEPDVQNNTKRTKNSE